MIALTGEQLIAWVDKTTEKWQGLISAHPEALAFACDVRESQTVADLLLHIVAVELRYAQRLNDLPESSYEEVAGGSAGQPFASHGRAMSLLKAVLDRDNDFWEESIEFTTRNMGKLSATRRVVLVHMLMHSIRHYAQLATLVRQHDVKPDWPMDYMFIAFA